MKRRRGQVSRLASKKTPRARTTTPRTAEPAERWVPVEPRPPAPPLKPVKRAPSKRAPAKRAPAKGAPTEPVPAEPVLARAKRNEPQASEREPPELEALESEPLELEWDWEERQRRRRRRMAVAAATVALVLAATASLALVRSAAGHYARGQRALAAEQYLVALQEFNAARVVVFSYRDAEALAGEARSALDARYREAALAKRTEEAVRRLVEGAGARLAAGDPEGAVEALSSARQRVPDGLLSREALTLALLDDLELELGEVGFKGLRDGRWNTAALCATGLLAIDASDANGRRLRERAEMGAALQLRLDEARRAADRGEWRRALRLADAVLKEWPGFPGAAALIQRARAGLAPKPQPAPTSGGTTTPPPSPSPSPARTTVSPPAPPPP